MKPIIKLLTFMLTVVLFSQCEKDITDPDVIVNIPDTAFFNVLLEKGIDTNGDSLISYTEAEAILSLEIDGSIIVDMTGIEAFINLDSLTCKYIANVKDLDLSNNTRLKYLFLFGEHNPVSYEDTGLETLNISKCILLTTLICTDHLLTCLDVSNNTDLVTFNCWQNHLCCLNVSNNAALVKLNCGKNLFYSLDISNNNALEYIDCRENPNLTEVCVWTFPFPPQAVSVYAGESPNVYFTTDCSK